MWWGHTYAAMDAWMQQSHAASVTGQQVNALPDGALTALCDHTCLHVATPPTSGALCMRLRQETRPCTQEGKKTHKLQSKKQKLRRTRKKPHKVAHPLKWAARISGVAEKCTLWTTTELQSPRPAVVATAAAEGREATLLRTACCCLCSLVTSCSIAVSCCLSARMLLLSCPAQHREAVMQMLHCALL